MDIKFHPLQLLVFAVVSLIPTGFFLLGIYTIIPPFATIWSALGNILVGLFLMGISTIGELVWIYYCLIDKKIYMEDRD